MVTTTKHYEWNRKLLLLLSWETDRESKRNTNSKSICMVNELQMTYVEKCFFYPFLTLHLDFFVNLSVCFFKPECISSYVTEQIVGFFGC